MKTKYYENDSPTKWWSAKLPRERKRLCREYYSHQEIGTLRYSEIKHIHEKENSL